MNPSRWQQIDELFARAVELAPTERPGFLDSACANDPTLRAELDSLLASDDGADLAVGSAVGRNARRFATDQATALIDSHIGPYKIVELLGEGGMGAVYRGTRDDAEYHREVAIKLVKYGIGSPHAIARFRDERQILAALEHPGIVRLLDGGRTDDGAPYLVMELVAGEPITSFRAHPIRDRVELMRRVCEAVQYAHGKLVVHRDLKPSNILVTRDGAPKLLDFGIAKLLDPIAEREAKTRTGNALLTPEYASPEQARGLPVSVASDVYSLGAVLYELLAGRPPLVVEGGPLEQLRQICEVDPPRPSTVAPADVRREIAGDLDNIVLRALHKDPAKRYASAAALSDDLGRYLDGFPVLAREATLGYRAGKLIRRHRGKLALATAVALALSAATVISIRQARRADEQAERAERKFGEVRKLANALLLELDAKLQYVAGATEARRVMVGHARDYLDKLAAEAGNDPSLDRELAVAYMKIGDIQGNGYEPNLGLALQGLDSYSKAMAIIDGLLAAGHNDLDTRRLKASAWLGVGILEHSAERPAAAFATLTSALAYSATLPRPVDIDRYVMRANMSMSYLHGEWRGEVERSEAYTKQLIDLARAALDATGSDDAHYWVGVAATRAGQQRMDAADPDAGCRHLEQGQKEYEELYRRRPDDARFVRELAYGSEILAGCYGGVSNIEIWRTHRLDLARAEALLREAFRLAESLARDPKDAQGTTLIADILGDHASIIADRDPATAATLFGQAHARWFALPEDSRKNTWSALLNWFLDCGMSVPLAKLGKRAEALDHAGRGLAEAEQRAAADAVALPKIHLQMCRYQVSTARDALGDRQVAIELLRVSADELEKLIRDKVPIASAYVGMTAIADRLVTWKVADACAFQARAHAAWQRWPGKRTPYIDRELARLASCP